MPRILITGSRHWTDVDIIKDALREQWMLLRGHGNITLVTGACPTGADHIAETIWTEAGLPLETHPANWFLHGRAAGPIRNQHMVNLGADICLAFPQPGSRGTLHCIEMAEQAGIPVQVYGAVTNSAP